MIDMAVIKRLAAPRFWPIERKTKKFVVAPRPGPHPKEHCLPLGVVLRDMQRYAGNIKEVKELLKKSIVKVDGKVRRDYKFPVGLMDVVTVGDNNLRVVSSRKGLSLKEISGSEAGVKLLKILNKKHVRGRRVQLNFHDGRNIIVTKDEFKTGDVVVFDLGECKIKSSFRYKRGSMALITGGKNRGSLGEIEEIINARGLRANKAILKSGGRKIEIDKNYIFVIGQDKPAIDI